MFKKTYIRALQSGQICIPVKALKHTNIYLRIVIILTCNIKSRPSKICDGAMVIVYMFNFFMCFSSSHCFIKHLVLFDSFFFSNTPQEGTKLGPVQTSWELSVWFIKVAIEVVASDIETISTVSCQKEGWVRVMTNAMELFEWRWWRRKASSRDFHCLPVCRHSVEQNTFLLPDCHKIHWSSAALKMFTLIFHFCLIHFFFTTSLFWEASVFVRLLLQNAA